MYYHKGKPYRIISYNKVKIDEQWKDCIIYECMYDNPDGSTWVRTKDDFDKNFTLVSENNP